MATGCGMAAAFLAMKEIYGTNVFQVDAAEAHQPDLIQARAQSLAGQFVFDVQTHFVRDDFDHKELLGLNDFAAEHWNPKIKDETAPGLARFKFLNYVKEIYYDSDTQLALLSGAPLTIRHGGSSRMSRSSRRGTWSMILRAPGACSPTP